MLGGFVFGLALQTHLSAIALAPGVALGLLLMRPRIVLSRWLPLSVLGFGVGYLNMMVFNLQTGFWSFVHARALQQGYSGGRSVSLSTYSANLSALIESLGRIASGTIDAAGSLASVAYLVLAAAGLVLLVRRGNVLPLAVCLSAIVVMPYFNPRYGPILSGRYLIPLLPYLYLGIAVAVPTAAMFIPTILPPRHVVARAALAAALALFPLVPLSRYYRTVLDDGRTNRRLTMLSGAVVNAFRHGQIVLVDEALAQEQLTAGGTDLKALRMLLESGGIPYQVVKLNWQGLRPALERYDTVLVVMAARKASELDDHVDVLPLTAQIGSASGSGHEYGVYVVERPVARRSAPLAGGAIRPVDGR